MRCHYLSDLHLESQDFPWKLPSGDLLIIAGDLCHARCLDPASTDKYCIDQRTRVMRFHDAAVANFAKVLLIAGNHDHYDGIVETTASLLGQHLPGMTVLDDSAVKIDGTHFFGTTLWSDFEGRNPESMNKARRRVGEFVFVKTRMQQADGSERLVRFRPENALVRFDASVAALRSQMGQSPPDRTVVITHHSPSLQGLNLRHAGNGLDGAYASDLDDMIEELGAAVWIHGHTHIKRTYQIGDTIVRSNCRGFDGKDPSANNFTPNMAFEI